jgi:hypothetical protein
MTSPIVQNDGRLNPQIRKAGCLFRLRSRGGYQVGAVLHRSTTIGAVRVPIVREWHGRLRQRRATQRTHRARENDPRQRALLRHGPRQVIDMGPVVAPAGARLRANIQGVLYWVMKPSDCMDKIEISTSRYMETPKPLQRSRPSWRQSRWI